jgi:hypothetical protein
MRTGHMHRLTGRLCFLVLCSFQVGSQLGFVPVTKLIINVSQISTDVFHLYFSRKFNLRMTLQSRAQNALLRLKAVKLVSRPKPHN